MMEEKDKLRKQYRIMVIDDDAASLRLMQSVLKARYDVSLAISGEQALEHMHRVRPSLILLDLNMPGMDGYEVLKILKSTKDLNDIPVLVLSGVQEVEGEIRAIETGAVDYIHKPIVSTLVLARIRLHLELEAYRRDLEQRVEERTAELLFQQRATVDVLAYATDCRDTGTGQHLNRTQKCVELILSRVAEIPEEDYAISKSAASDIVLASPLHDLGKVTIPDAILLKPGKLTMEEFEEMKRHTTRGAAMLDRTVMKFESASLLKTAREIALSHHEKWNGEGYPCGLSRNAIPLSARVMALADVYDALRTERPYKKPFDAACARGIIMEGRGTHFDPVLTDVFSGISEELEELYLEGAVV